MDAAVKFAEGSDSIIEGIAIPFGGPVRGGKDLQGEKFSAETDYAFDWFPAGRPLIYHHGIDGAVKTARQGYQTEHEIIDEGIWARAQLDKSAKYHATVERLVRAGKLFFSSGTFPHLATTDRGGNIKTWPWIELSLTPTPANPYAAVHFVKSAELLDRLDEAGIAIPPALVAAALKALDDEGAITPEDDSDLPAGSKFAEHADRLLADVEAFRDRTDSLVELRAKAGRVLSASTRERLMRHPALLRELADDLDGLLSEADSGKSVILADLQIETERSLSRLLGVAL